MNVHCMKAGICEDEPGYLQNAESGSDFLTVQVELVMVYLTCIATFRRLSYLCKNSPGSVFRVKIGQQEPGGQT